MRLLPALCTAVALFVASANARATVFTFDTDPFAGTTALTTPGRQVVGGEAVINFSIASDIFAFDPAVFGISNTISFANDLVGNLPTSGINVVVLQTTDDDANPATPFAAGNAANLIAAQIVSSGPGFFIYFNQGLNLPRLVFSTDLNDNTADLKILARMTNFVGQSDILPAFTAANFAVIPSAVPEPCTWAMILIGFTGLGFAFRQSRCRMAMA